MIETGKTNCKVRIFGYLLYFSLFFLSLDILVPMNPPMVVFNVTIELRLMACPVFSQVFACIAAASAGGYDREFECFWQVLPSQHIV